MTRDKYGESQAPETALDDVHQVLREILINLIVIRDLLYRKEGISDAERRSTYASAENETTLKIMEPR